MGKINGTNLDSCGGDREKAKSIFMHKFQSKTKNAWTNRLNFIVNAIFFMSFLMVSDFFVLGVFE